MMTTDAPIVAHRSVFPLSAELGTVEGIVDAVRCVLLKTSASVQSIHISTTAGMVVEWDGVDGDVMSLEEGRIDLAEMLHEVPMDEVDGTDPAKALGTCALLAESAGLVITHALIGTKSVLWRWLGADDADVRPMYVGGGLIHSSPSITRDELFLFSGPASGAPAASSTRVTRIFMEPT